LDGFLLLAEFIKDGVELVRRSQLCDFADQVPFLEGDLIQTAPVSKERLVSMFEARLREV